MAKKEWRSFEQAREYARSLGLRTQREWGEWCKSGERPPDIPTRPDHTYKDDWQDMGDWLGTGSVAHSNKKWRPFEEAREYARGLGLQRLREWKEWCKSGLKPEYIPAKPREVYEHEWQSMGDWLGTGHVANKNRKWRSFEEAREFVRGLGLGSYKEWEEWCQSGQRPTDIPAAPWKIYKDKGWQSWPDWLGSGFREYRPFGEAREFARRLGLRRQNEWREWCKSGQKPEDVPANPDRVYEDKGWQGWGDWLDTGNIHPSDKEWRPFGEAREFVRGLGLRSGAEWKEWCQSEECPPDIPATPDQVYEDKGWRGIADWLGYSPLRWDRAVLLTFLEDLRPRLPYLEEKELYAILQQGGAMPTLLSNLGKRSPMSVIKDLKENAGRGLEEAIREAASGDEEEPLGVDEEEPLGVDGGPEEELEKAHVFEQPVLEYTDDGLPALATAEGLRAVDELANLHYGLDAEVAAFLVSNRVASLWTLYIKGGPPTVENALAGTGGHYFELIRSRFYAELEGVENLPTPDEWAYTTAEGKPTRPLMMQRRCAWEVLTKKRVGNWSGVGAGKTLAAVLASRVSGCKNTLIVANNSTIDNWCKQIQAAFPDSVVHTSAAQPVPHRFNYFVLNYEKFQQSNRGALVHRLIEFGIEFVVFDEVQLVKQRDKHASLRRQALAGLVSKLAQQNPDLRVLGMSATPVINNLLEARKLLEIVSGRSHADLDTQATVNNALAVHRALMVNGFRYRPSYEIEMDEQLPEVVGDGLLEDILQSQGVLGLEQALLPAKLEAVTPYVRKGCILYIHYVEGMVGPTRRHFEK